jgi:hypothetical protein
MKMTRILALIVAVSVSVVGCGGSGGDSPPPSPVISGFVATASILTVGESATITPTFRNGGGTIDNGIGVVTSGNGISVSPAVDTTYTLTVSNSAGDSVTRQLEIRVVAPPEITGFASTDAAITNGESTELTATFINGEGQIDGGVGAVSSGVPISIRPTENTVYTLSVTNEAGTTIAETVTVEVVQAPSITSFHLKGCTSLPSEDAILRPIFESGTGVVDNGIGAVSSDEAIAVNPATDTTYTLTVTNSLGSTVSEQLSIVVNSAFLLIDSGEPVVTTPVNDGGYALNINQSLAAEFALDQTNMMTCVEGFIGGEIPGSASITIYDDGGEVPGNELYTNDVYFEVGDGWQGLTGMDLSLPAGKYWVSFELRSLDDDFLGRMLEAPQPLLNHAYTTHGYPPLNLQGGSEWVENDSLDLGVRIKFLQGPERGVIVGDKEWRQLTETVGFSWEQVAAVCDEETGVCTGAIGSIDLSGWFWASALDVGELFSALTPHPGDISQYNEVGSQWAPDFLARFNANRGGKYVWGMSRTQVVSNGLPHCYAPFVYDAIDPANLDIAKTNEVARLHIDYGNGVWLYKPVPNP